jgi:hypothetical protein
MAAPPVQPAVFESLTSWLRSPSPPELLHVHLPHLMITPDPSDAAMSSEFRLPEIFDDVAAPAGSPNGSPHASVRDDDEAEFESEFIGSPVSRPPDHNSSLNLAVNQVIAHATDNFLSTVDRVDQAFEILIERAQVQGSSPPLDSMHGPNCEALDAAAFHAAAEAIVQDQQRSTESSPDGTSARRLCVQCHYGGAPLLVCQACDHGAF